MNSISPIKCNEHMLVSFLIEATVKPSNLQAFAHRQRRSHDFFFGGATRYIFVTSPGADRIQWGGVVAEIFRDLNYRIGFGGGGGVADVNKSITFPRFRDIFGPPADHQPFMDTRGNSGTLPMSACTFKPRNNINSFRIKTFTKSLGGPWPPWPPPLATPLPIVRRWLNPSAVSKMVSKTRFSSDLCQYTDNYS